MFTPINKTRATNKFMIGACCLSDMNKIDSLMKSQGYNVTQFACDDPLEGIYRVRAYNDKKLVDFQIQVQLNAHVMAEQLVGNFRNG